MHNSCVREGQKKAQNKTKQTNIKKKRERKKTLQLPRSVKKEKDVF